MSGHTWIVAASLLLSMLITGLDAQASNCVWTPYPGTLIYGGTPVSSANSLAACQAACVGTCTGVDWAQNNAAGSQCFLQQKKTDKVNNVVGVDHYDYDCTNSGGSGGCSFSQPFTNTNIYGGAANPASSLQACLAACQLNTSCQGIDWAPGNSAGQQCFLLSTTSGKNPNAVGVTHYDYYCNGTVGTTLAPPTPPQSIVCLFGIQAAVDTSSIGGFNVPEIAFTDCVVACYRISTCIGYDVSPTTGCWFHFNDTAFRQKFYHQSVTQIQTRRCPGDDIESCTPAYSSGTLVNACASACYPRFTAWQNTAGSGGQVVNTAGFRNVTSCLEYCFLQNPNCVGVDYSEQPGSPSVCTVYTQLSLSNNVIKAFVTQYRLESRCSKNCTTYWESDDNLRFRLYNPMILTNIFTQADCLRTCRVSPTCEAYQFTKSGPGAHSCIIADNFFEGSGVNDSTVFTGLYRENCTNLAPRPPPTPPGGSGGGTTLPGSLLSSTTIVPTNCWDVYNNTLIYGGTQNPATSLNDCYTACRTLGRSSCLSVDWARANPVGSQCFLLKTQMGKVQAQGVDHYDLRSNC